MTSLSRSSSPDALVSAAAACWAHKAPAMSWSTVSPAGRSLASKAPERPRSPTSGNPAAMSPATRSST
eukprot:12435008-Heterocapsa_arctica.AAC.1